MPINYYSELEVDSSATTSEINSQYRKLCLKYHPDKFSPQLSPETRDEYTEKFKLISIAATVLRCPKARAKYDESLQNDANDHSYFDNYEDFNEDESHGTRVFSEPHTFTFSSALEDHYYCLLMASRFDESLLDEVLVETSPSSPQIRAMKRFIMDIEKARKSREERRRLISDGIKQLQESRKKSKKSISKPKENTDQAYTKSKPTLGEKQVFNNPQGKRNSNTQTRETQTGVSLMKISSKYSSILDALFESIQNDNSSQNECKYDNNKKTTNTSKKAENDDFPSSTGRTLKRKLSQDSTMKKGAKIIKIQAKSLFVSHTPARKEESILEMKNDFVGKNDCQGIYTLNKPNSDHLRKYKPALRNPTNCYFNYWVYFDGNSISEEDQRTITDSHIYLLDGQHTCALRNKIHNHEKKVVSRLKRTIELHLQPSLFSFVCAHCNKLISVVTNMYTHLKSHLADSN